MAASIIRETAHPDANLIFGAVIDETLGEEMRITVIATGFDIMRPSRRQLLEQQYGQQGSPRTPSSPPPSAAQNTTVDAAATTGDAQPSPAEKETVSPRFSPNTLDIPAFLRRR